MTNRCRFLLHSQNLNCWLGNPVLQLFICIFMQMLSSSTVRPGIKESWFLVCRKEDTYQLIMKIQMAINNPVPKGKVSEGNPIIVGPALRIRQSIGPLRVSQDESKSLSKGINRRTSSVEKLIHQPRKPLTYSSLPLASGSDNYFVSPRYLSLSKRKKKAKYVSNKKSTKEKNKVMSPIVKPFLFL